MPLGHVRITLDYSPALAQIRRRRRLQLGHRLTMVVALQNHSGNLNSTACINAAEPRHQLFDVSGKATWLRPPQTSSLSPLLPSHDRRLPSPAAWP